MTEVKVEFAIEVSSDMSEDEQNDFADDLAEQLLEELTQNNQIEGSEITVIVTFEFVDARRRRRQAGKKLQAVVTVIYSVEEPKS